MMRSSLASTSFGKLAFLAALTLASGCGGDPSEGAGEPGDLELQAMTQEADLAGPAAKPPRPPVPSVTLAFADFLPTGAFDPLVEATIWDTAILYIVADWKNVADTASERLDIQMPGGALYAGMDLPIAETTRGDLDYQVLADGTKRLTYFLYVWGTPIEFYNMTGLWTATATLVNGTATDTATVTLL